MSPAIHPSLLISLQGWGVGSPLCSDSEWLSSVLWVSSDSLDIVFMLRLTFRLLTRKQFCFPS